MHRTIVVAPVVHDPVPVSVRVRVTLALKFSRSPYLDNHSSENIHTWTIDTYTCRVSFHFMTSDPWVQARGWDWRLKSRTPSKMAFLWYSFLEVHILTTTHQKALILGPLAPCRAGFHSIASDPWIHTRG